jgi:hypothetical protein
MPSHCPRIYRKLSMVCTQKHNPTNFIYTHKSYPHNRPGRAIVLWYVEALTFSRQLAHIWWRGCQLYAPATLYTQGRFLVLISVKRLSRPTAMVQVEWLGKLKNPMTSGFEPATFRLVAQCPNLTNLHKKTYCQTSDATNSKLCC